MQKTRRSCGAGWLGLLIGLGAFFPSSVAAQPFDLDTPADSPVWWPVSEGVSSETLRAAYRSPEANRERYREAVAANLAPPQTEEQLQRLKFYLNPKLTPKLETVFEPFITMADTLLPRIGAEVFGSELASFGVSPEGVRLIISVAQAHAAEAEDLSAEIGPKHVELIRMHWSILDAEGRTDETRARLDSATKNGDVEFFVQRTGKSEEEVRELLRASKIQPSVVAGEKRLRQLRTELAAADWRGLLRYLLDYSVSRLGAFTDF